MARRSNRSDTQRPASGSAKKSTALVVQHSPPVPQQSNPLGRRAEPWLPKADSALLHDLHMVWLQLRAEWNWIAVVPGDPSFSTSRLVRGLSEVGARLSSQAIDYIEAADVDLDNASWLIGRLGTSNASSSAFSRQDDQGPGGPAGWIRAVPRTLVALESPLKNPLALPIALAADGVVLCVRSGESSLGDVRRTIEAVGPDHVVCTVMID
jgi:hypothetical protein